MKLLFTNAGRRNYLVEFTCQLKSKHPGLEVFVSDTSIHTACFWVDGIKEHFILPNVSENPKEYISKLLNEAKKRGITLIIPLMDFELLILSECREQFKKENIEILVSDRSSIEACINKKMFFEHCKRNEIPTPDSFFSNNKYVGPFPVIIKQIEGSGSVDQRIVRSVDELKNFVDGKEMIQPFIAGEEYGMDILCDTEGAYLHSSVRKKLLMRSGETDKAVYCEYPGIEKYVSKILASLKFRGNVDLDFIVSPSGEIYFIDINPRFGGGYPVTHLAGFNYLDGIISARLNKNVNYPKSGKKVHVMKGISLHYFEG